jgi:ribosomal-protein-alanine N-acetyltransferase
VNQAARLLPAAPRPGRVELRRMRWWDIPAIILLEHAAFPDDAWSVGMFWSELAEAATRYYLVAEEYPATDTAAAIDAAPADGAADGAATNGAVADPGADVEEDRGPRIIGYAGLLAGMGEAEVLSIAVDPAREGRGLGAVLLTELMREAARRACDDVVLEVRVDNDRAQRLYQRFGFAGIGVRKGYYQPANVDALVMRTGEVIARFGGADGGL